MKGDVGVLAVDFGGRGDKYLSVVFARCFKDIFSTSKVGGE